MGRNVFENTFCFAKRRLKTAIDTTATDIPTHRTTHADGAHTFTNSLKNTPTQTKSIH